MSKAILEALTVMLLLSSYITYDYEIAVKMKNDDRYDPSITEIETCYKNTSEEKCKKQNVGKHFYGNDHVAFIIEDKIYYSQGFKDFFGYASTLFTSPYTYPKFNGLNVDTNYYNGEFYELQDINNEEEYDIMGHNFEDGKKNKRTTRYEIATKYNKNSVVVMLYEFKKITVCKYDLSYLMQNYEYKAKRKIDELNEDNEKLKKKLEYCKENKSKCKSDIVKDIKEKIKENDKDLKDFEDRMKKVDKGEYGGILSYIDEIMINDCKEKRRYRENNVKTLADAHKNRLLI